MTVESDRKECEQKKIQTMEQEKSPLLISLRQTSHTLQHVRTKGSPQRWTISSISTELNPPGSPRTPVITQGMEIPFFLRPPCSSQDFKMRERSRSTSLPFLDLDHVDLEFDGNSRSIRVVVLGVSGVGKTTLIQEFMSSVPSADGEWPDWESVISDNIEEVFQKTVDIDDKSFHLEITDAPAFGTEAFEEREDKLLEEGDAYILVYSITNRRSFKKANELRFKLQRSKETETVPIILVGNKTDLERSREVSFAEAKHFAALFDCKLIETSASLCHNVDELFHGVATQVQLRKDKVMEDFETSSGGSGDSGKSSPSTKKSLRKRRGSKVLERARVLIGRILRRRAADEPIPGYRARSKSCHMMDVL